MGPLAIGLGLWWLACAGLGCYVSVQKGRDAGEGLILGLLFGPLGVVAALFLPTIATLYPRLRNVDGKMLVFDCPACGCEAKVKAEQQAQLSSCRHCRSRLRIPSVVAPVPAHSPPVEPTTFIPAKPGSGFPLPISRYIQGDVIVWICRCGEERMARRDEPGVTGPCRKCGAVFEIPG